MAKKGAVTAAGASNTTATVKETATGNDASSVAAAGMQRPAAECRYADELSRLVAASAKLPRPPGWQLTPRAVLQFILGDESQRIAPKFVGRRAFLERCIVALATNRSFHTSSDA